MATRFYVDHTLRNPDDLPEVSRSGPFTDRKTAEQFAIAFARSGACLKVTIVEERDREDAYDDTDV